MFKIPTTTQPPFRAPITRSSSLFVPLCRIQYHSNTTNHEARHRQPDRRLRRRLPAPHGPQRRPQELERSRHEGAFPITFQFSERRAANSVVELPQSCRRFHRAGIRYGRRGPSSFYQGYISVEETKLAQLVPSFSDAVLSHIQCLSAKKDSSWPIGISAN